MAKQNPDSQAATETLQEIEGALDRVANWVTDNPAVVLSVLGSILLVAAIAGGVQAVQKSAADDASEALAEAQADYFEAMGATPGSLEIVEPANPERAREIREEFVARFLSVADEHEGSGAAVSARLEASELQARLGESEAALESLRRAASEAPSGVLEALAEARLASALEAEGSLDEAAEAWARASAIEHPTRDLARAQGTRLFLALGQNERARELAAQIDTDAPSVSLPPYLSAAVEALRAPAAPEPAG